MHIDLHTHSVVSDGTDTPTRLVLAARDAGLDVIALTDHDTLDGLAEAKQAGRRVGVHVLGGVELSCDLDGLEVHVLGYGPRRDHRPLLDELARLRQGRRDRLPAMLARLAELGVPVEMAVVRQQAKSADTSLGRPHVADAMVVLGYVADRDEAFSRYLADDAPAYVPRPILGLGEAIDLLHGAGAAVVLAHPGIRGVGERLQAPMVEHLVAEHGLDGIEVDYPLHDQSTRDLYHRLGERLDLVRTGSSDYHGSGKVGHELGCRTTRDSAYHELVRRIRGHGGQPD